ncbi:MAG: hypothetical protein ABI670_12575 [Chloroflexota bacterium]
MHKRLAIFPLLLVLLAAGCGDSPATPTTVTANTPTSLSATALVDDKTPTNDNTSPNPVPTNTESPSTPTIAPAPPPTETSVGQPTSLSDSALIELLKLAGLPIGETVVYTAETDPNKLLGRPNQYIAKASWHDTRLGAPANPTEPEVSDGGGLEIYIDADGAKSRMDYIQELGKKLPLAVEYDYVNGPILLRLSKELTPAQAKEYEQIFIVIPMQ